MATPIRWTARVAAVLLIVVAIVAIDHFTDIDLIGTTVRFVLGSLEFAVSSAIRSLQLLLRLVLRRRIWRSILSSLSISYGYSWRIILSDKRARRADIFLAKTRSTTATMRTKWHKLSFTAKLVTAIVLAALQIVLFPVLSEYIVLFPVGFLIPTIVGGARRIYGWIGDLLFGATYETYIGKLHRKAIRWIRNLRWIRITRGALRLTRLRYLTAWRIWKYNPTYRTKSSELAVSFIEPVRLWKNGKLDRYVGRPLFKRRNT